MRRVVLNSFAQLSPDSSVKRGPFSRWLLIIIDLLLIVIHFRKIEGLPKGEHNQFLLWLTKGSNNLSAIVLIKYVVLDFEEIRVNLVSLLSACSSHCVPMATQQRPHTWEETELPHRKEVSVSGGVFVLYGYVSLKLLLHRISKQTVN